MLQRPRRRCEGTAMGAIVLDLRPGLGIGPFTLGSFSLNIFYICCSLSLFKKFIDRMYLKLYNPTWILIGGLIVIYFNQKIRLYFLNR